MIHCVKAVVTLASFTLVASAVVLNDAVDYGSLHCPESGSETLVTPTYGSEGAVFTLCTELRINASPILIFNTILDFNSYPQWNSFIVQVDLPSNVTSTPEDVYIGMPMKFTSSGIIGGLNTTSTEVITLDDDSGAAGYLINAWRFDDGLGGVGSRAEHPKIIVDLGDGTTRFVSYETYYEGLFTGTIALLRSQLQEQFEVQGLDLKEYVESMS